MRDVFRAAAKDNPDELKTLGLGTHGSAEYELLLKHYKELARAESDATVLTGREMDAASGPKDNGRRSVFHCICSICFILCFNPSFVI